MTITGTSLEVLPIDYRDKLSQACISKTEQLLRANPQKTVLHFVSEKVLLFASLPSELPVTSPLQEFCSYLNGLT